MGKLPIEKLTRTTREMAAVLLITPQWLRVLERQGWIRRVGRDRWPFMETVQGYVRYLTAADWWKRECERRSGFGPGGDTLLSLDDG